MLNESLDAEIGDRMIFLAEIVDKVPSVEDTAVLGGVLALVSVGLAFIRWWIGGLACLFACAVLLVSAYDDLTDSTLRPIITTEFGDHYPWARVSTAGVPLLAAPAIACARRRQRAQAREGAGRCGQCGYAVGASGAELCPECGYPRHRANAVPIRGSP